MMIQIITSNGGTPCFPMTETAELVAREERKVVVYSAPQPTTVRREYHGTEYVVNGRCAPNARETAPEKMLRLILNDSDTI